MHVSVTEASLAASSSCPSLPFNVPSSGALETGDTPGRGITSGVTFRNGRWVAWVENSSWPPSTAVYPYMMLEGCPARAIDVVNVFIELVSGVDAPGGV